MNENETAVPTSVRLERSLRQQLEDAASSSFRTLSHEIAYRLKRSFERKPDEATAA